MANERGGPDNITVQILSIPADESRGDPEATAPVELSHVGIEAIESRRLQRKRTRSAAFVIGIALAVLAIYLAAQHFSAAANTTAATTTPSASVKSAKSAIEVEAPADQFEIEEKAPRRGIPR